MPEIKAYSELASPLLVSFQRFALDHPALEGTIIAPEGSGLTGFATRLYIDGSKPCLLTCQEAIDAAKSGLHGLQWRPA